jgi:hypothetical protein
MALLMVIVGAAAFGLSCAGILPGFACDQPSLIRLVWVVILAITANQSMWLISKPPAHETVGTDDTDDAGEDHLGLMTDIIVALIGAAIGGVVVALVNNHFLRRAPRQRRRT